MEMDAEATQAIKDLTEQLKKDKPRKSNVWVDYAMRAATTLSAAGAIALFSLFTTQLPDLRASIADVKREQEYFINTLTEVRNFTKEPRFTKEDFTSEMRLYDQRLDLIDLELNKRTGFFNTIDSDLSGHERRINKLEAYKEKLQDREETDN